MGLEVLIPKGDDVECGQWAGRFWWSVALGLPVVFLAMAPMLGLSVIAGTWVGWAKFLLSIPVVFWWGADVWKRGKGGRSVHVCRILRSFQRSAACGSREAETARLPLLQWIKGQVCAGECGDQASESLARRPGWMRR